MPKGYRVGAKLVLQELGLPTEMPRKPRKRPARVPEARSYLPIELQLWKRRVCGSVRFTATGVALEANGVIRNYPTLAAATASVAL